MRRRLRSALLLLVALALLAPAATSAAEYTVTTASDNELDNNCAAPCSLHQAIAEANQIEGEDVIRFSIGAEGSTATIADTGAVPMAQITEAVTIDGWSQGAGDYAGPPLVELAGPGPFAGSPGLRITTTGGDTAIRGLAINGFQGAGIQVEGSGATIAGNYIGTSLDGMADDGNGGWGVDGGFGDDVTVGGDQPAEGNLISGNGQGGVSFDSAERPVIRGNRIGLNAAGTATIPNNGSGVNLNGDTRGAVVGGLTPTPGVAPGNVIVGSTVNNGIAANNSFDTQPPLIQGNTIGTNVAGAAGMGNTGAGVFGNDRVLVGTGGPNARNVISGNTGAGVVVEDTSTVANTTIGLTPDGTTDLGNGGAGVDLHAPATVSANRIGGNAGWGVTASSLAPGAVVEGNTIGTNAARTLARPNDAGGVNLDGVEDGIVRDNHIAGHTGAAPNAGLRLDEVVDARVHGNRIGLNGAGSGAIANTRGILFSGLSSQTVIGPSAAGQQPNTISGNGVGIRSEVSGAQPNTIAGNRIGTNVAGTQGVPNTGDGIAVAGGTDDLSILRNAIAHNGGLGIDLADDGVTANDAGDLDGGPNGRQNHPTVTEAAAGGGRTTARGRIEALPGKAYRIEVFRSAACDPSGSGEGATYLGAAETTTNGAGDATWSLDLTGTPTQPGEVVTATATERATPGGQTQDTSELSPCATAAALPDEGGPEPVDTSGTGDQGEPTPEAQRTAGAEVVSGRVTVTLPDGRVITLTGAEEIPMGSKVDTTQGRVKTPPRARARTTSPSSRRAPS